MKQLAGRKYSGTELCARALSLIFVTRVAPHCVNTLMILHAAHTLERENQRLLHQNVPAGRYARVLELARN